METYLAVRCSGGPFALACEAEISNIFWGFLIVFGLVVCCFLAWKAIGKLSNRVTAEEEQRTREEFLLTQRKRDEFLLNHGTEMERRASQARIDQRRKAEEAQQKQSKS